MPGAAGRGMSDSRITAAVAAYLCRHRSVGILRLVDDLLKLPGVRKALKLSHPPAPDTPEWWRAYNAVTEAVRELAGAGAAEYLASVGVVNWRGPPCG